MKKIDLDSMTEEQLRSLNYQIIRRLEFHATMRRNNQLMAFRIGDHVAFDTERGTITGVIIRINHKTASIEGDDGRRWRVSPSFLPKVADAKVASPDPQTNLFPLPGSNSARNA